MWKVVEKAFFPLLFAIALDGFQAFLSIALLAAGAAAGASAPFAGAGTGAAIGCAVGGTGGAVLGAAGAGVGAIPGAAAGCVAGGSVGGAIGSAVGTAAAATITPLGIVLGFIVNAILSLTFGVGLITLLSFQGMFYPFSIFSISFSETIPVFDNLPTWTALVLWCSFKKLKEEPSAAGAVANAVGAILTPTPQSVAGAVRAVDGIRRTANENQSYAEAA